MPHLFHYDFLHFSLKDHSEDDNSLTSRVEQQQVLQHTYSTMKLPQLTDDTCGSMLFLVLVYYCVALLQLQMQLLNVMTKYLQKQKKLFLFIGGEFAMV
jgi:hypothetical protein